MTQPIDQLVSVILPIRNSGISLRNCLDSLLAQTYPNLEIIAIDDASRDNSYKILREYRRKDKRLIISRNVKQYGMSVTLNRALKKARGSYLALMNQKDTSTPDRIKRQIFYLRRHPKVAVLGTQAAFIDSSTHQTSKSTFPTDHDTISKTFLTSDALQLESIVINRYLLPRDLLRFDNLKYPMVYRTLLTKILPYGIFANLNQHLYMRLRYEARIEGMGAKVAHHLILWSKARFLYGTGISWNSLIYPLNNRVRSSLNN